MVSGTPDLYIKSEQEIWDFKTGRKEDFKLAPYWTQLKCYFHGLYEQGVFKEPEATLKILFVDEQIVVEEKVNLTQTHKDLTHNFGLLSIPDQYNLDYCQFCNFGNICHYNLERVASN
jgi:hypothetical protein